MAGEGGSYLGVTPPISVKPPSPEERRATEQLVRHLKSVDALQTSAVTARGTAALAELTELVEGWARALGAQRGAADLPGAALARLLPFGSFELGAADPKADLDLVLLAARSISRADFFGGLTELLRARPEVGKLHPVPEARVPVTKLQWKGLPVDLLFAGLPAGRVDGLELEQEALLRSLDEPTVRSINGARVAAGLLRLVPDPESFRLALLAIKLWAKRRLMYSNGMGLFSGVALGIMTARVCQLYPQAAPAALVCRFFRLFGQWKWPNPVLLRPIDLTDPRSWNPATNFADRRHSFPVITPAVPTMNAMAYCSPAISQLLVAELKRGAGLCDRAEADWTQADWSSLFERPGFFQRYRHYLWIQLAASSAAGLDVWLALVESRLRALAGAIEKLPAVQLVQPNPVAHRLPGTAEHGHCAGLFFGLLLDKKQLPLDLTKCRDDFVASVREPRLGFVERQMMIRLEHCKQSQLPVVEAAGLEPRLAKRKRSSLAELYDESPPTKRGNATR